MKDIVTNRIDLLLAKIAGRNVNINTMSPPVASDMTEKLLLEIADRVDDIEEDASATTPAATASSLGTVKMAANVPEASGAAPTAAEFKALLDALIASGAMAAAAAETEA